MWQIESIQGNSRLKLLTAFYISFQRGNFEANFLQVTTSSFHAISPRKIWINLTPVHNLCLDDNRSFVFFIFSYVIKEIQCKKGIFCLLNFPHVIPEVNLRGKEKKCLSYMSSQLNSLYVCCFVSQFVMFTIISLSHKRVVFCGSMHRFIQRSRSQGCLI